MKCFLKYAILLPTLVQIGCSTKNIGEPTPNLVRLLNTEDTTLSVKKVKIITYIEDTEYERSKSVWEVAVTNHLPEPVCFKPVFKMIGMSYRPMELGEYSVILEHTTKVIGYAEDSELEFNGLSIILPGYGKLHQHSTRKCLTSEIRNERIQLKKRRGI